MSRSLVLFSALVAAACGFVPSNPLIRSSTTKMAEMLPGDLDVDVLYVKSNFPYNQFDLVKMAKEVVITKGIGLKDDGECLADDFTFRAAFVETPKDEFFKALKTFKLEDSFNITQQYWGWNVDPLQTNRVWFFNRQEAVFVQDFSGAKADNRKLVMPPQCYHVDFNDDGKVTEFGFYVIDRAQGNTGGLGGAFGYFYGVGKPLPFPEGRPYKMSLRRRMFSAVARFLSKFSKKDDED